jgi:hypothetical protein
MAAERENAIAKENKDQLPPQDVPLEPAQNPNPRANENIPERTEEPASGEKTEGVGSEITDGEDA